MYGNNLGPEGAKAIAPAIRDSRSLTAVDTRFNGIHGEGAEQLAAAVLGSASMVTFGKVPIKELRAHALTTLNLSGKALGPTEAIVLAGLLPVSLSLTECTVRGNDLDITSAKLLAKLATEKRVMLFGIKHHQTEADFRGKGLKPPDAVLIANDISVSRSLSRVPARARTFISHYSANVFFHCDLCDV